MIAVVAPNQSGKSALADGRSLFEIAVRRLQILHENRPPEILSWWISPGLRPALCLMTANAPKSFKSSLSLKIVELLRSAGLSRDSFNLKWEDLTARSLPKAPKQHGQENQRVAAPLPPRYKQDRLSNEIRATFPAEAQLLRPLLYQVKLNGHVLELLLLQTAAPKAKQNQLRIWREDFEAKHPGLHVLLQMRQASGTIRRELKKLAQGRGLLTKLDINRLKDALHAQDVKDVEAAAALAGRKMPRKLNDFSSKLFIAIDDAGTRDREDLVAIERISQQRYRLWVAVIDISWIVEGNERLLKQAQRKGAAQYGRRYYSTPLGSEIAYGKGSFRKGEPRSAWLVALDVDSMSGITATSIKRGIVTCRGVMTYEKADQILSGGAETAGNGHRRELRRTLADLSRVADWLRSRRLEEKSIIRSKQQGRSGTIIEESMKAAKSALANFLAAPENKTTFIRRVQAEPDGPLLLRLCSQIKRLGIPGLEPTPADFQDPRRFVGLLRALEEVRLQDQENQLLDAFMLRASYSTDAHLGHFALGVRNYGDFKPRISAGVANQLQLAAVFAGKQPPFSKAELDHWANRLNRQMDVYSHKASRIALLEDLIDRLKYTSSSCAGRIVRKSSQGYLVQVTGFSRWGLIEDTTEIKGSEVTLGSRYLLEYRGFSPAKLRDIFEIASAVSTAISEP